MMNATVLKIEGMSCSHCKMAVEKALKKVAGVEKAEVDLNKQQAVIVGSASRAELLKAVDDAGYKVIN